MAGIVTKTGTEVLFGDTNHPGYQHLDTWGRQIQVADAGVPLAEYSTRPYDPVEIWKTQPSVRKVIDFIARQVAAIPWKAYERVDDKDRQRASSSPAERLMREPAHLSTRGAAYARLQTGYRLWRDLMVDRLMYDLCVATFIDDELVRIPPRQVSIKSDTWGRIVEVLVIPDGNKNLGFDITDAPLIIDYGWHGSKAGGLTPMRTLAKILEEASRSVAWRNRQWKTSPKTGGLLKRPPTVKKWDPADRERFIESWRQWRDSRSEGTPILEDGMEYEQLTLMSPRDAQDLDGRKLTDAEVASMFHIAPELVGAREGNFSNIEAFREMLYGPTLGPLFSSLQQAVAVSGVIEAVDTTKNLYLEMDREAAMAGSFMDQARRIQTMVGGPIMTRAEGRALLNLPHLDGTDDLIVPLNVTQGGLASPTDTGDQNVGGDNAAPENRED